MNHTRLQLPIEPPYTAYISGLPKDTDSVDVRNIFNYQGIRDVRFANDKDVLTCYVEFKTLERLKLAVAMNGVEVKGLPVKIAVARDLDICRSFNDRKPYPRKAPFVAYVGNLRDDVDYDDIHQIFGAYNVKSIIFMHDLLRQVCYVEFKTLEDLMNAVQLTRIKIRGLKAVIDVGQRIDIRRDCDGDFIKQPKSLYPTAPPFTAFVGNLPKVFQGDILRIFCHQNVKNTTFIKNNDTGEFKNCCFVEFETLGDLKEAVKMNRRVHVNNQVIRINLPGDRGRGGGDRNGSKLLDRLDVYIGDLPDQVRRVFNQENVRKIKFVMDNDSKQFKGSCFVQFRTLEVLKEAVRWDGGVVVEGLMIKIAVADHSAIDNGNRIDDVKVPFPTEPPYVAHVSNLPTSFVRHNVASVFKNQNVQSVRFSVDKKTKRSNEICWVKFERTKDLDKAVKMDGVISVRGRTVTMDIAKNFVICRDSIRFPTAPPFTAFVAGLPDRIVAGDIRKIFHKQNVKKVRLMFDKDTNRFRNFGFVDFETLSELEEVINMNGTLIVDGLKITIRLAKPQADDNI